MTERRWTMYIPVLLVLVLSIPLVYIAQWRDFDDSRELSRDVVRSSGIFTGFTEDTSTTVSIIPDTVIDSTISDTKEDVNVTDSSGNTTTITQNTPKRSIVSGIINAVIMVGIAIGAAFVIYKLFIKRRKFTLKMFFTIALGLCASVSVMLYLYLFRDFVYGNFDLEVEANWLFYTAITLAGLVLGSFIVYNMVFRSLEPKRKNPALIAFCILLGAFLAIVLPVWAVIPLLTGVAVWDLWAAKRGIIKDMITESDKEKDEIKKERTEALKARRKGEAVDNYHDPNRMPGPPPHITGTLPKADLKGTSKRKGLFDVQAGEDITTYGLYEGKYYSLGIGDFIFFSVLVSATFKWMMLKLPWLGYYVPGWGELLALFSTGVVMALVILGLKKTLSYLDKESVMPGLPLSVLFGLVGLFGLIIFIQAVNLIYSGSMVNPF